ncbi:MAG: hypothetical protein ACFB0C_03785 [Leptolyngbyaceae cyanobacterium]
MALSNEDTRQLLNRLVFGDSSPEDWVQDVWALSPTLGETAARLVDAFEAVNDCNSPEKLENFVQGLYKAQLEDRL